ncbi:MAG: hypothetical protein JRF56_10325 [Deltaproteobacteria bacterium]|jgi:flagellar basal-body rod protein FlgC|nr:hypothetical protein [Deltaproteobacteria bacterium]
MFSSVHRTISALQAYKTQMNVTSNNVANVNSNEFKKSKAALKEGPSGGVQVKINFNNTPSYHYQELEGDQIVKKETSNVDLAEELPQMMVTQHAYEANMKVLQVHDEMLGTTLDILG